MKYKRKNNQSLAGRWTLSQPPGQYRPAPPPPGQYYPPPQQGESNVVKIVLGVGCGCLGLTGLVTLGFIIWLMSLPDSGAMPGGRLSPATMEYLYTNDMLSADEEVIYYYDATISMTNEESCFFTDQKIAYWKSGSLTAIPWEEVEDIDSRDDLDFIISVSSTTNDYLTCEIAPWNGGPEFYQALVKTWENKQDEMESDDW